MPLMVLAQATPHVEYWFDTDHAHATIVSASYGTTSFSPDVSRLGMGLHRLYYRFQSSDGKWSVPHTAFFVKNGSQYTGQWLCEYWFDQNQADRKTVRANMRTFSIQEDVSRLSEGMHRFCYRIQGVDGRWGEPHSSFFLIPAGGGQDDLITAYQYWFDENDSHAEMVNLDTPASPYLLDIDLQVDDLANEITPDNLKTVEDEFGILQVGRNTALNIRFKGIDKNWSNVHSYEFANILERPIFTGFLKNPDADEGYDYWEYMEDGHVVDFDDEGEEYARAYPTPSTSNQKPFRAPDDEKEFTFKENSSMSQKVEGLPKVGLRLSFWAAVDADGEMTVSAGDKSLTITSTTWQAYHFDFLSEEEDGRFIVEVKESKGNGRVDHFTLSLAVDEMPMHADDFAALKRFYNETGGDKWAHKWNFADTPAATDHLAGVKTREGRVTRISLPNNNLTGNLGTALFSLPELTDINLSGNALSGDLATWMELLGKTGVKCTHLRYLDISDNALSGNLGAIGDAFPELVSLRASKCHFSALTPALPEHIQRLETSRQTIDRTYSYDELIADGKLMEKVPTILLYDHSTRSYKTSLPISLYGEDGSNVWESILELSDGGFNVREKDRNHSVCYLPNGSLLTADNKGTTMPVKFNFRMGDVDFNGNVSVSDLQKTINLSLERYVPMYNHTAANTVVDDVINIQDVAVLVNAMVSTSATMSNATFLDTEEYGDDAKAQLYVTDGCLVLNSEIPIAALDVTLTGGTDEWESMLEDAGMQCTVAHETGRTHLIVYSITERELPAGKTVLARTGRKHLDFAEVVDIDGMPVITAINGAPTGITATSKGLSLVVNNGVLRLWTNETLHDFDWQVLSLSGQTIAKGHADNVAPGSLYLCRTTNQPVLVRVMAGDVVLTKKITTK